DGGQGVGMRAEYHRAITDAPTQRHGVPLLVARQPVGARRVHPELVPLFRLLIVEVEAAAAPARCPFPLFHNDAAIETPGDAVVAERLAGRVAHVPVAEPEIELPVLRRRA